MNTFYAFGVTVLLLLAALLWWIFTSEPDAGPVDVTPDDWKEDLATASGVSVETVESVEAITRDRRHTAAIVEACARCGEDPVATARVIMDLAKRKAKE